MTFFTDKLVLRTVSDGDLEEVARMWDFENGCISKEKAEKAIRDMQGNHAKNLEGAIYHLCLAVFEKGSDTIIGWCGLDGKNGEKLHLFYLIDAGYRRKGYATQCAERLLSYAFEEAKVPFVNGGCDKNNLASYRVMSKIGMLQTAFEENGDPLFYLDAATYRSNQARKSGKCAKKGSDTEKLDSVLQVKIA